MSEIWKEISGYKGLYEVSNFGKIKSIEKIVPFRGSFTTKKWKVKNIRKRGDYLGVTLCKLSVKKTFLVHQLVASAFIPNPENKPTVNHKDCDTSNNHVDNLEWATQKENIDYAVSLQRHCHGETHGCHKLTEDQIRQIRSHKQGGNNLAKMYDVSYSTIKRIRNKKAWRHVV